MQIYMTPQDDRTADVLSNALGRSTVTAVTESQSRIRALEDSANVSRRSEERPLISANELLRFPLGEVLVLPEGQYPIRARHVRYYEDRHFGPIDRARKGVVLHDRNFLRPTVGTPGVALMGSLIPNGDLSDSMGKASAAFAKLSQAAKSGPKGECRRRDRPFAVGRSGLTHKASA